MENEFYEINIDRILFTHIGDEGVVYDIEKNEYINFNETLFQILIYIQDGKSKADIVKGLLSQYSVTLDSCMADVSEAILEMEGKNYIRRK